MSLTKDEIIAMAREAGGSQLMRLEGEYVDNFQLTGNRQIERFTTLCRAPLVAEVERLKADLEQTRVQLACCGVAAMQNTEESKANRVERGAYGWSASYGDVCRMVDREIEMRAENARLKDDYQNACKTVAEMHAAAVGQIVGPNRGVVEDVADLRAERDDWKARAEAAEAEIARVRALYATPPSAVPVVEQLVEALDGLFSGDVVVWSLGGSARPRAAITAGQKFIKENGK